MLNYVCKNTVFLLSFCFIIGFKISIAYDVMREDLEFAFGQPQFSAKTYDDPEEDELVFIGLKNDCAWCGNDLPDPPDEKSTIQRQEWNITIDPLDCYPISSPNYPSKYPKNIDYRYYFKTHPDAKLDIFVPKGGIQLSNGCHRDKLSVINSTSHIVQLCGKIRNFTMTSDDTMYVRFETNHKYQWQGFAGNVCASEIFTTTQPPTTTPEPTTTPTPTTTATLPAPIFCDDICGDLNYFSSGRKERLNAGMVPTHKHPWYIVVDVFRQDIIVRCSGYLISRHHVITSAYCFYQAGGTGGSNTTVRLTAGETDMTALETPLAQVVYTTNITVYTDYSHTLGVGVRNLALITLMEEGFNLNENVFPICLHTATMAIPPMVEVAGYGWTANDHPQVNQVQITMTTCPFPIAPDLFCTYIPLPTTPCHGDAGAPLIHLFGGRYYAVGHINAITNPACPLPGGIHPAVKLSFFQSWLDSHTGTRICNPTYVI